ncbi:hypothetical protein AHF37_09384, partial [Paragonimus kellicotti]
MRVASFAAESPFIRANSCDRSGSTQSTGDNVFHLKKTDISTYHSVLVWIKIHMKTNMEYELQLNSTVKEKDQLNELRAESYRITEAVTLLNELASKDKEKVKELLQQLRLWNRQQPTNITGKCSPPTSSSGEILTSSGSELSGTELSETESEIISEVAYESSKVTHFTKEYRPNMTYVLPAIFTYDEQSLSDEIGSSGEVSGHELPPSRFTEDDYFENQTLHKWRFEKEFVEDVETTETESVNSDVPGHYISTKHLPMGMTLDPHLSLQSGTRSFFKSRRQINTTDLDSSYSVVYIEVARSDPAMQSQLSDENLRGDQRSKEVQVDQRVLTPRVKKIVELREEEEAESSVLKQQKRTKIIPVRIKKQDASTQVLCTNSDVAVDARPCKRDVASMISDKDEIAEYYKLIPIRHISSTLTPILTEHSEVYGINTIPTQTDPTCSLMVPEEYYYINTQESAGTTSTHRTAEMAQKKTHRQTQTDEKKMSRTFAESAVAPTPSRPGHCSLCGQRVPTTPDRPSEPAVPVPVAGADRPALTDVGVGSDVAAPDSVEQGVGVVTAGACVLCGCREAKSMVGGEEWHWLECVTAADGVPTIRIPSAIDSKSGVSTDSIAAGPVQPTLGDLRPVELRFASQSELIDACGSGSTADWVDSQLAVQSVPVLLKGFGVQTDARVGPVHADRMVDRATSPVSTSVGDYGPVSAWTQTREEAEAEHRVPEESVSLGVRERMRPASVQAS